MKLNIIISEQNAQKLRGISFTFHVRDAIYDIMYSFEERPR